MKCPKCGYLRQTKDHTFVPENECPSCGVIYGKLEKTERFKKEHAQPSSPLQNPSPVSAASLQKARERVERRLLKQEARKHESRHSHTLELARKLSVEGVRQRQAEWKKQNEKETTPTLQKDNHMMDEKHTDEPTETVSNDTDPVSKIKHTASTIAMAIKKREHEPNVLQAEHPSKTVEKARPSVVHATPAQVAPSADPVDTLREKKITTSDTQPREVESESLPDAPIPLSQQTRMAIKENLRPPTLKEMLKDLDAPDTEQMVAPKPHRRSIRLPHANLMRLLPLVAWLILGAGVIGAILSWSTLANAQASIAPSTGALDHFPLGLLLGFAYLATGVLGFAFFWVSSLISRQLKDIQRLLKLQSTLQA